MRILVIDDEFKLLNLIRQELATQGYEADIAPTVEMDWSWRMNRRTTLSFSI